MLSFDAWWTLALFGGYAASLFVLIPWVLLKRTVHPSAAIAWVLTIIFLPYLGGILALLLGLNRVERHRPHKRAAAKEIARRVPGWSQHQLEHLEDHTPLEQDLARLAFKLTGRHATARNRLELLPKTPRAFEVVEEIIDGATNWVHVEFYIWKPDKIGTRIRDALVRKARQGVAVRFLYDSFGSWGLNRKFLGPMADAGIHSAAFLPGRSFRERWSMNLRSHRKIILVDGQIGFTGGMNVGDEYLGRDPGYGYWRDTQVKFHGPAVLQMQQVFAEDWYYATGEDLTEAAYFPEPEQYGDVTAQVIAGGPEELTAFHGLMFAAISQARDRVTLATSYFIPPDPLAMALETAAHRGVRVRILVSRHGNFIWTLLAGRAYFQRLLKAGAEIYEYREGFYHAKTLTVDGVWSLVGTPNFDSRSILLNFEDAVAILDRGIAQQLEEHFEGDRARSDRVDLEAWINRPLGRVLGERFCRLFAPVL